jgi:hypothetical protein
MESRSALSGVLQRLDLVECVDKAITLEFEVVPPLEVHPEPLGRAEVPSHPERRVGRDATLAVHDLVDASRWHADGDCQSMLGDAEWLEEFVHEDFAWMDRRADRESVHEQFLSVVIDNLDVFRSCGGPPEADSPLLVDPDAVFADAITLQLLKPIARRDTQVTEHVGGIEDEQLPEGDPGCSLIESSCSLSVPNALGLLVSERPDHVRDDNGSRQ